MEAAQRIRIEESGEMGRETYLIPSIGTRRSSRQATPHDRSRSNLPVTGMRSISRSRL